MSAITFSKDDFTMRAIRVNYLRETRANPYGIGDIDNNVHDASVMSRKPMTPPQTPTATATTKCSRSKKYSTRSPRTAARSTRFTLARTTHCDVFALPIRATPSIRYVLCVCTFSMCVFTSNQQSTVFTFQDAQRATFLFCAGTRGGGDSRF